MKNVPLNLNELMWLLESLRVFIGNERFDNDQDNLRRMGELIAKLAKAAY